MADKQPAERSDFAHRAFQFLIRQRTVFVNAAGGEEAFETEHPASHNSRSRPRFDASTPPQKPTCTYDSCNAHDRLLRNASTVSVGGTELSGMSNTVVMPPAAAARVAHAKPSHAVRPGSLICT